MTDDITIFVDGRQVTPTTLRRALLPLVWLFLGFAALGFVSGVAERSSLGWGLSILAVPLIVVLALRHTHEYDPVTEECTQCRKVERTPALKRLWRWLRAEWADSRKKSLCRHPQVTNWQDFDSCPDCGYVPMFEIAC